MSEVIKKDVLTLGEIQQRCSSVNLNKAYVCAQLTDEFILDDWHSNVISKINISKILDIRVFNKETELRWFRGSVDRDFVFRSTDGYKKMDSYCEKQYLDIDSKKGIKDGYVYAPGAGKYRLPEEFRNFDADSLNNIRIILKNFIDYYPKTGQAYIFDWALAGFTKEVR